MAHRRLVGLILEDDRPAVGRERPDIVALVGVDVEAVGCNVRPGAAAVRRCSSTLVGATDLHGLYDAD